MYRIAIDIGGTNIKVALIDQDLKLTHFRQYSTPDNVTSSIADKVYEVVTHYISEFQLDKPTIGISTAGVVNEETGEIVYAGPTIPNYTHTNFKQVLAPLSADVYVKNDVNAALLGELLLHHYDTQRIFCLTLGTGIGGAFINGRQEIDNGETHKANEIGYLLYRQTEHTTFEQRASTSALKYRMQKQGFTKSDEVIELFEAAVSGDALAHQIISEWAEDLAEGIAQIQIMYDPGLILIGGGISAQGKVLVDYVAPRIAHYLPEDYRYAPIQTTQTMNNAALFGSLYEGVEHK